MGFYNAAAWINRRERHLAVNAIVYCLAVAWEQRLVAQHIRTCRSEQAAGQSHLTLVSEAPECGEGLKVAVEGPWPRGNVRRAWCMDVCPYM
jgi:hypothetical protein